MDADATSFADPGLYPLWALQPLAVAASPQRFADCDMSASLLANDQVTHSAAECRALAIAHRGSLIAAHPLAPTTS